MSDGRLHRFCLLMAALAAILIQIQMSVMTAPGSYLGLRVNLADLMLPVAGLVVLVTLLRKKSLWPRWSLSGTWVWLIVLSGLMLLSFLYGYTVTGEWSRWALTNKLVGWFVLVAYFCLGGWLATNSGAAVRARFLKFFIATFCLAAIGSLIILLLSDLGFTIVPYKVYPLAGVMGNRNAFALLCVVALVIAVYEDQHGAAHRQARWIGGLLPVISFLLPALLVGIGSRTGAVVMAVALLALVCLRPGPFLRRIVPYIAAGMVVVVAVYSVTGKSLLRENQISRTIIAADLAQQNPEALLEKRTGSEAIRLRVNSDAVVLWQKHKLIGAGLGSFLTFSHRSYDGTDIVVDLIDCTPLWLLTETGLVGLALFATFYAVAMIALWRRRKDDPWAGTMVLILFLFALMALVHEVMFTRFMWLLLGLSLGTGANLPQHSQSAPVQQ